MLGLAVFSSRANRHIQDMCQRSKVQLTTILVQAVDKCTNVAVVRQNGALAWGLREDVKVGPCFTLSVRALGRPMLRRKDTASRALSAYMELAARRGLLHFRVFESFHQGKACQDESRRRCPRAQS